MGDLKTTAEERDIPRFRRTIDTHTFQSLALVTYDAIQDVNTLLAENAKLRAALKVAADDMDSECEGWGAKARDALATPTPFDLEAP